MFPRLNPEVHIPPFDPSARQATRRNPSIDFSDSQRKSNYLPNRYFGEHTNSSDEDSLEGTMQSQKEDHQRCNCSEPCRLLSRLTTGDVVTDDRIVDLYSQRELRRWAKDCYAQGFVHGEERLWEFAFGLGWQMSEEKLMKRCRRDCKNAWDEGWRAAMGAVRRTMDQRSGKPQIGLNENTEGSTGLEGVRNTISKVLRAPFRGQSADAGRDFVISSPVLERDRMDSAVDAMIR